MSTKSFRKSPLFRYTTFTVLAAFIGLLPAGPSWAQVSAIMPPVGQMIQVTGHFEPPQMVGLKVNLKDPFSFGFIMDQGQSPMSDSVKKEEFNKIIKYFLVSLAMPNKDMWVNLSPFESKRIIPEIFGQTEMGRDLLAQDYVLKQFTASLMYPENGLGKTFWSKVYEEGQARFGTTDINVNTFNKVWIVADHADVYQKGDTAFLVGSHLKVMLEQDFKAIEQNKEQFGDANAEDNNSSDAKTQMASQLVREIIIPAIEKEVNEGQSFAPVRQIYNAEIMATWFKKTLRASLLGQVFADKSKIAGQKVNDPQAKEKIFQQYLTAYKQCVFNFIKQEATPDGQVIPRRYLSGGEAPVQIAGVGAFDDSNVQKLSPADMASQMQDLKDRLDQVNQVQGPDFQNLIQDRIATTPLGNRTIPDVVQAIVDTKSPMTSNDRSRFIVNFLSNLMPSGKPMTEAEKQDLSTKLNGVLSRPHEIGEVIEALPQISNISPDTQPGPALAQAFDDPLFRNNTEITAGFLNDMIAGSQAKVATEAKVFGENEEALGPRLSLTTADLTAQTPQGQIVPVVKQQEYAANLERGLISSTSPGAQKYIEGKIISTPSISELLASPQVTEGLARALSTAGSQVVGEVLARWGNPTLALDSPELQGNANSIQNEFNNQPPETKTSWLADKMKTTPSIAESLAPAQVTQQFANVLSTVRPQVASQILAQLAITNDAALLASQPTPMPDKLGGINLSNEHLTLNVKVDGAGMPLPPQYQDKALLNLNGLVSVIRSITPITKQNVPALYELAK